MSSQNAIIFRPRLDPVIVGILDDVSLGMLGGSGYGRDMWIESPGFFFPISGLYVPKS